VEANRLNRARIKAAINQAGSNITLAARLLGISRDTLRYRVRKYGLTSNVRAGQAPSTAEEE
jgi:transcriptional regulator with GAF, ATPase, and Fis domain